MVIISLPGDGGALTRLRALASSPAHLSAVLAVLDVQEGKGVQVVGQNGEQRRLGMYTKITGRQVCVQRPTQKYNEECSG